MEDSKNFRGTDSSDLSTLESYNLQNQPVLNNNALDLATHETTPQDPNIVDWNGPDDPENALNWSSTKKFAAMGIVALITMLS